MRRIIQIMQYQALLVASIVSILFQSGCTTAAESPRERISINNDWRFTMNDPSGNSVSTDSLDYPVNPGRGRRTACCLVHCNNKITPEVNKNSTV